MFPIIAEQQSASSLDFSNMQELAQSYVLERGPALAGNAIAAILILVVGLWLARLSASLFSRILMRAKVEETLCKFLGRIAQAIVVAIVILAALDRLGVDTTSFAAVLAAAGLAIGMALQGSLSNFAAGVMIVVFRPFKVGDLVETGGVTGIVEEIHIFSTLMRTGDNVAIVVPNSSITSGNICNFSSKPTRRIDLIVGCSYNDDLRAVKQLLIAQVRAEERVLADPEPVVAVSELADSCVNFVVRPWVKTADYWDVRWQLTEDIKLAFDQHGFEIPFPQQELHMRHADAATNSSAGDQTSLQNKELVATAAAPSTILAFQANAQATPVPSAESPAGQTPQASADELAAYETSESLDNGEPARKLPKGVFDEGNWDEFLRPKSG